MSNLVHQPGRALAAALAAACALGAGAASLAAQSGRADAGKPGQRVVINQMKVDGDGVRIYVDPATGRIKQPTPAEVRALDQAIASLPSREVKSFQATQYADGTVSIALDGAFMNFALVRVNDDGSVTQACVDDAAAADAFLRGAPAAEEQ
jgi:hypothetical protein